jgi:hypothetical protein
VAGTGLAIAVLAACLAAVDAFPRFHRLARPVIAVGSMSLTVRRQPAGQFRVDTARHDQLLQVCERGLRRQLGGAAAGGAQQCDHVPQLVERVDAQRADGAHALSDIRVLHGHLERTGLYGDQADLVGDDVVHLTGRPGGRAGDAVPRGRP